MTEKVEKRVAGSLTRFYVVALFIVAMLTLGGLYLIRKTIMSLNYDGRVVNVAGRQRMLSQRLAKLAILKTGKIAYRDSADFDSLLTVWKESNQQLATRKLMVGSDIVTWKSGPLDEMFARLEPVFNTIYQGLNKINDDNLSLSEKKQALDIVLQNEPVFLNIMNDIVFQFDKESFARLKNLERIEWILDIMTILVLFAEGLLIFRPVVNTTRRAVRLLTESEDALLKANRDLERSNSELIRVQKDILRIEEEKYQLQLAEDRIRASALIEGQEEERRRFARELHDGIGQMLTGLKLHAEKLGQTQFTDEKQRERFNQLVRLIQDTIQTTRQISYNLMPSVLSDFGISAALNLLCQQTSQASGLKINFQGIEKRIALSQAIEIGLYRIAQEALNNVVKHAGAENVNIRLEQNKNSIILQIEDDGKGFLIRNLKNKEGSFLTQNGIDNIRTRTQLLDGSMEILSEPDHGTTLEVKIFV
ncbi:ATP-binding protein [Dyadobacter psychrotolerans]|uniref:histidine kinase n=1 Tax=Dyadobacter psychrotolerans TaxID=2541721 RepID=A0A4R5DYC8_9BACT|nr:histidine kinase [Dyadobacter psychrotolerans]TDE17201.1 histidine kinase [Dyadobacter psychrotolerans]